MQGDRRIFSPRAREREEETTREFKEAKTLATLSPWFCVLLYFLPFVASAPSEDSQLRPLSTLGDVNNLRDLPFFCVFCEPPYFIYSFAPLRLRGEKPVPGHGSPERTPPRCNAGDLT